MSSVSLRFSRRLFLSHSLLVLFLVVALSLVLDRVLRSSLLEGAEEELRRELALGRELYDREVELDPDALARRIGVLTGYRVSIIEAGGRVLGDSGVEPEEVGALEDHSGRPEVQGARAQGEAVALRTSTSVDAELLYAATMTERGDVLRFAVGIDEIDARVARVRRWLLQAGAGAILLAALLSLGLSHALSRRLRRMRETAAAMASGDLSVRVRPRTRDELGDLGHALDSLAAELEARLSELEEEREEMQALIDSMAEGVLAVDADGRVVRANPAARRIFHLHPEFRGAPPEEVARRVPFLELARSAALGETLEPTELSHDGKHLLVTAEPLPRGGAVLVFLDITELRRLEGVRRDFVANVSHELKTPLTVIRGHGETLLDEELPPELRRKFTETVRRNADRLQEILDDLLDLSRIESGGWRPEVVGVDLDEEARKAWEPFREEAEEKGVGFDVEVDPAVGRARADPSALHQIFTNLFSNALRYTEKGGGIRVNVRVGQDERVEVAVEDTGSGIPGAHLERIFERFYRVDPARSRAEGGTGLGLAIVRHLVERHGGEVRAESELGQGTTIHFTLPH